MGKDSMTEVYISVDIESAGPIPGKYSMLALGACEVGQTDKQFYIEIQPINDLFVPEAMNVIGRPLSDFEKSGVNAAAAMQKFVNWIDQVGHKRTPVFVGFNGTFDWSFVNWYFHTYLKSNPFGFGGIDIKSYYMGLSGSSWKDTRSSRIPAEFKGNSPHTHNALDDAIEQAQMFELMRNQARLLNAESP
jgi:DNA polymerase III alpha subunit (gram-positive type)